MDTISVTFKTGSGDINVSAAPGSMLLEIAQQADVAIDAPCGGNGSCGKCRVRLLEGSLDAEDSIGLSPEEKAGGWYLACKSVVSESVTVELPEAAGAWQKGLKIIDNAGEDDPTWRRIVNMLKQEGVFPDSGGQIITLEFSGPNLDDTTPDAVRFSDALYAALGTRRLLAPLSVLRKLPELMFEKDYKLRCLLRGDAEDTHLVTLLPPDSTEGLCGLACDIGTTGVSVQLIDLLEGQVLSQVSVGNAQIRYGADVINRIIQQSRPGGVERLRQAIIEETVNPAIAAVCKDANISPECIAHVTIAGNTTMNHLLLGIPADHLRKEPYVPCFYSIQGLHAGEIGLAVSASAPVYFAPNVGSYVGGDITAGILVSGLWQSDETQLFIDLGTNGELVFGNREFMITCACSAGPAFEGGDIKCGMRATDGAIEAVTIEGGSFTPNLTVVGDGKPAGICGSGLIDLVSELFRCGAIDGKGRFIAEGERFSRDAYGIGSYTVAFAEETVQGKAITLSEIDLENFIRAKGAIFSAITVMLDATGFSVSDISQVFVAGGIGSGIDIDNAISIGLFPDIDRESYSYIGNTSLYGARAMARSTSAREKIEEIASGMTYLELSNESGYMDAFVAACFLPHTDVSLFPSIKGGQG